MPKTNHTLILFLTLTLPGFLHSQTIIGGNLSGTFPAGDYIVKSTINVLTDKILSFSPGSKLYFEAFCGIVVEGALICNGVRDSGIIFSSYKTCPGYADSGQPGPFDWNGVMVKEEARGIQLSHVLFEFSSLGLIVESNNTLIKLQDVIFSENGSNNFKIDEDMMQVPLRFPFSYPVKYEDITIPSETLMEPASDTLKGPLKEIPEKNQIIPIHHEKKKTSPVKIAFGIGSALVASTGIVLWIAGHINAEKNNVEYRKNTTNATTDYYRSKRDRAVIVRNCGIAALSAGTLTLTIVIIF
jgi:hypothetical protein